MMVVSSKMVKGKTIMPRMVKLLALRRVTLMKVTPQRIAQVKIPQRVCPLMRNLSTKKLIPDW
jgi:hypothetical protein